MTCNNFGNEFEHDCTSCYNNHYFIYGTNNCIKEEYAKENGYYFNTTYNQYVKCDKACLTCSSGLIGNNTNCIKCNENMGYYSIKGKSE